MMSSMTRAAFLIAWLTVAGTAAAQSGSYSQPSAPIIPAQGFAPYVPTSLVDNAIGQWRALRQNPNYPFSTYASFLISNAGFPGEKAMRAAAERAITPRAAKGWAGKLRGFGPK